MHPNVTLVVFSHLRWNFVYQRPQHLLTRLSKRFRVIFIEEPLQDANSPNRWETESLSDSLVIARPRTQIKELGFHDAQLELIRPMMQQLFDEQNIEEFVAWFYSPLAIPLLEDLDENCVAVIYDCMDELSGFRGAPPELVSREAELLQIADVVFTGGPSLFEAKKSRHPSVHCFSSSVDAQHFGQSKRPMNEPDDQNSIPRPRLGYYGVIDERMDLELIAQVADANPNWQVVMVGPVVKIDPGTLPQRENIHYLGQKKYELLPHYLANWDVCLMPFARNEATRCISPTKVLEYMAADKPIVSTSITDVAVPYGGIVAIADAPKDFAAACERALNESSEQRQSRIKAMNAVIAATSWEKTASAMQQLIEEAIQSSKRGRSRSPRSDQRRVVVIGAGPTGLSAAYHLGDEALLLEREGQVGGWCRSIEQDGFTFDYAGHIMFSNDAYVHEMYEKLLGDNVHWQDREAWIYSKNVYTRYPFQGALYGLPPDVIKECIVGAIESRYGELKSTAASHSINGNGKGKTNGHSFKNGNDRHTSRLANASVHSDACKKDAIEDCCGDGISESTVLLAESPTKSNGTPPSENFEQFIYRVWGAGIAKHFAIPYNRKLWAVPLEEMETSWLGGRVPMPDLEEMIEGALRPVPKPMGPNARFGYPLRGGFQALMNGFLPALENRLRLNTSVVSVSPARHVLTLNTGEEIEYEKLISTMPLPVLIRSLGNEVPEDIAQAARKLRHVSVRCVHLGIKRERLTDKALDLLSGGYGLSSHLRPGQCEFALQSAWRVRLDMRDHLLAAKAAAVRRRGVDPALHRRLPASGDHWPRRSSAGKIAVRSSARLRRLRSRTSEERRQTARLA